MIIKSLIIYNLLIHTAICVYVFSQYSDMYLTISEHSEDVEFCIRSKAQTLP